MAKRRRLNREKPLTNKAGEVREWTQADFARAVPFSELPQTLQDKLSSLKNRREPQKPAVKKQISLTVSRDVLDEMQATGKGWRQHIEEAMREWLAKQSKSRKAAS